MLCFAGPTGLASWGAPGVCLQLPAGPGGRAWVGLWLPAGSALGCLAGPDERQSASLGALGSAWVEASPRAGWVRVKSINGTRGRGRQIFPYFAQGPASVLIEMRGPGCSLFRFSEAKCAVQISLTPRGKNIKNVPYIQACVRTRVLLGAA